MAAAVVVCLRPHGIALDAIADVVEIIRAFPEITPLKSFWVVVPTPDVDPLREMMRLGCETLGFEVDAATGAPIPRGPMPESPKARAELERAVKCRVVATGARRYRELHDREPSRLLLATEGRSLDAMRANAPEHVLLQLAPLVEQCLRAAKALRKKPRKRS